MSTQIRAVVSDLDGTFWWGRERLHPSTMVAVEVLQRRKIPLLFATGRRFASAHRGLTPLGLTGPTVLLSGAVGADLGTGEEWHRRAFDAEHATTVLASFRAEGLEPVVYVCDAHVDAVTGPGCSTSGAHLVNLGKPTPTDPRSVIDSGRVVGFGVCGIDTGLSQATQRIVASIAQVATGWVGPDHVMGGWTLMVGPTGISKVSALQGWCDARGLAPHHVMAVGDGSNDLEMLDWAGRSVAVRGGAAEQHGADHIIDQPQDGGWATLLDLL
ncbi:MAG: HAD family hydrolase [Euzebya sp.]